MENKKYNIFFAALAILALILSLFGIISAIRCEGGAPRILLVICSGLLLILAFVYITVILFSLDREPNFFLCDESFEKNQSVSSLSFDQVASRADAFIEYVGGAEMLLKRRLLIDGDFGMGAILRPVVSYRLLQYASKDRAVFSLIENTDDKTFAVLCQSLEAAGEQDLPQALVRYRERGGDPDNFCRFLNGNYKYIQNKMMSYVLRNLELFY